MNTRLTLTADGVPAATGVLDTSIEDLSAARLSQELGYLSAQNDRLLKRVDTLLHLHESEKAQRQSLQTTLDRLLETVGSELRNDVSQDLKPLLHAIIELLELAARREPTDPKITSESGPIADTADSRDGVVKHDGSAARHLPEDTPGALPEILTKSVEELVGKRRADRQQKPKFKKPRADGYEDGTAFKGRRSHGWIPVTSGTRPS